MKLKSPFVTLALALALTCAPSLLMAQLPDDPGQDPDPGAQIPVDGGLSLLVAAGIGYAAKKGYDKRKKDGAAQNQEG
jgi:hypothetical protein